MDGKQKFTQFYNNNAAVNIVVVNYYKKANFGILNTEETTTTVTKVRQNISRSYVHPLVFSGCKRRFS